MTDFLPLTRIVDTDMASELGLSGLHCELSETFASKEPEHRDRIRKALTQTLSGQTDEDLSSLLDLQFPPRLQSTAISISHCPTLGGFVHLPKRALSGVGFDIEMADRVSAAVGKKILPHPSESHLHSIIEHEAVSIPACVWVAKESAIKSVGNSLLDRQVFYGNLALTKFIPSSDASSFQFHAALTDIDINSTLPRFEARGIVRKTDQWIVGLAISYSVP